MKKYALLVIDCQNYFLDKNSPAFLPDSKKIRPKINQLIETARKNEWPVIYTVHTAPTKPGNLMAERWNHLPSGYESEIYKGISVVPNSIRIKKEFFSAFHKTKLESILKEKMITDLIVCGAMTHLCVDTTVRHGFMLDYRSTVITDACCSKNQAYHKAAIMTLKHGFSRVMTTTEFSKQCHSRGVGNP
jgi:nicotinamidase-related amidase